MAQTQTNNVQFIGTSDVKLAELIAAQISGQLAEIKESIPRPEQLMTRQQAADFLSVDKVSLWRYTKGGKIPAHQIGSRVYYKRSEILECLERINPNKKGGEK